MKIPNYQVRNNQKRMKYSRERLSSLDKQDCPYQGKTLKWFMEQQ